MQLRSCSKPEPAREVSWQVGSVEHSKLKGAMYGSPWLGLVQQQQQVWKPEPAARYAAVATYSAVIPAKCSVSTCSRRVHVGMQAAVVKCGALPTSQWACQPHGAEVSARPGQIRSGHSGMAHGSASGHMHVCMYACTYGAHRARNEYDEQLHTQATLAKGCRRTAPWSLCRQCCLDVV